MAYTYPAQNTAAVNRPRPTRYFDVYDEAVPLSAAVHSSIIISKERHAKFGIGRGRLSRGRSRESTWTGRRIFGGRRVGKNSHARLRDQCPATGGDVWGGGRLSTEYIPLYRLTTLGFPTDHKTLSPDQIRSAVSVAHIRARRAHWRLRVYTRQKTSMYLYVYTHVCIYYYMRYTHLYIRII